MLSKATPTAWTFSPLSRTDQEEKRGGGDGKANKGETSAGRAGDREETELVPVSE